MPTKISWTDETWNPVVGCTKCSPGCKNCYAERMAYRLQCMGIYPYHDHPDLEPVSKKGWNGQVSCNEKALEKPLHWKKPRRVFVCSMGDLFHPAVPFEFIDKVIFTIYRSCRFGHTFQILTKRVLRMAKYFSGNVDGRILELFRKSDARYTSKHRLTSSVNKLPNLHLGVSISTQAEADEKIPILLQIPAAVRWVSIEPMLEPIDIRLNLGLVVAEKIKGGYRLTRREEKGKPYPYEKSPIEWVVVGCESGPRRRPCKLEWVRDIVAQCKAAGVPVFVKQIEVNGKVSRKPEEWPKDLRVQE